MIKLTLEFEDTAAMLEFLGTAKAAPAKKKAAPKKKKAETPTATAGPDPVDNVTPIHPGGQSPSGLTLESVHAHVTGVAQQLGPRCTELSGVLAQYGVKATSELPPEQFDRFIESVDALLVAQ